MSRARVVMVGIAGAALVACSAGPPAPDQGPTTATAPAPSPSTASGASDGCPGGADPDRAGDPTQPRPALWDWYTLAATDPTGPRIVVGETGLVPEGAGSSTLQSTWTFDVCTNTWTELGDGPLPAPEKRPGLGEFVADPSAGVVVGLPTGLSPVWRFDPVAESWSAVESGGGGSDMAWPTVAYDTGGDRLLAFDANVLTRDPRATGVLSYDPDARAWTQVDAADPEGERPRVRMDRYDTVYDSAARRLVLVVTPEGSVEDPARVWLFDPVGGTWSQGEDLPRASGRGYRSGGWAMAFDPVTERTWLFADTQMLGYDARADEWTVVERGAGWPGPMTVGGAEVDPMARLGGTMVVDPVNERLVVLGGRVRPVGDPVGGFTRDLDDLPAADDVWAFDPQANTWTMLLAVSDEPPSIGPG